MLSLTSLGLALLAGVGGCVVLGFVLERLAISRLYRRDHLDHVLATGRNAANALTPSVGDANTQTPEFKAFLVNIEPTSPPVS